MQKCGGLRLRSRSRSRCSRSRVCAYVTLVMFNPNYIVGALTMAYSLKHSQTKHKILCMLTTDLAEHAPVLSKVFDEVIMIDYLEYKTKKLKTKTQTALYETWISRSFTKWRCLQLTEYDKVCFLDADMIILQNLDHLFDVQAPAGCFVNPWIDVIGQGTAERKPIRPEKGYTKNYTKSYYSTFKFGEPIEPQLIAKALEDGYVCNCNCVLLEPDNTQFEDFEKFMRNNEPFGTGCISGPDEQAIALFLGVVKQKNWHFLGYAYNTIPWHMKQTNKTNDGKIIKPIVLHYFGKKKPWQTSEKTWSDLNIWYDFYKKMLRSCETELPTTITQYLKNSPNLGERNFCTFCDLINSKMGVTDHTIFTCPSLIKSA